MRYVMIGLLATLFTNIGVFAAETPQQTVEMLPQVEAVKQYLLEKDYPEFFDKPYRMRVINALVDDLDGDGVAEVALHTDPHYRQSATITIFRVSPAFGVTRVMEGLAPGPLVPLTGDHLDGHTLGRAVDIDLQDKQSDETEREKLISHFIGAGQSVVAYSNFFHIDVREKGSYFLDMSHLAEPSTAKNCNDFEFSKVKQIASGTIEGLGKGNLLAAWVGSKVFLYRINAVLPSGRLDKTGWEMDMPADFSGFAPGMGGPVKIMRAATATPLAVNCTPGHCTLVAPR